MTAGLGNPAGYVPVFDGGNPGIISGRAAQNLSGGMLVYASGAAGNVSSGLNSFVTTDIAFLIASGGAFTGIVTQSAASGAVVSVATRGTCILLADGTVTAGLPVSTGGLNAVANSGSVAGNLAHQRTVGRALSSAGSEGFCLVDIGRA